MLHIGGDYQERIIDTKNLIPKNEPVFLLRGKDKLAPSLLLEWAKQIRLSGGDPEVAELAEAQAQNMLDWQRKVLRSHGKLPDMPNEVNDINTKNLKVIEIQIKELSNNELIIINYEELLINFGPHKLSQICKNLTEKLKC